MRTRRIVVSRHVVTNASESAVRAMAACAALFTALLLATACSSPDSPSTTPSKEGSTMAGDVDYGPGTRVIPDSLALSGDGRSVLAPCSGAICRWDVETGAADRLPGQGRVAVSESAGLMATVGDDASVMLVDLTTAEVVRTLTGHTDETGADAPSSLLALGFSPDGERVASAGTDGSVRVWSVIDGAPVSTFETENRYAARLAFSADSERLAVTGNRAGLQVYDVATGDVLDSVPGAVASAYAVSWSGDGAQVAGAGALAAPTVWDGSSLEEIATEPGRQVKFITFAPDDASVAYTSLKDKTVRIWSFADEKTVELVGHTDSPSALAFSPDGRTLYSAAARDGVWAWDIAKGSVRRRFE